MIFLGKFRNKEVAFRYNENRIDGCHYDIKILPKGTIKRLIRTPKMHYDQPIPYSGEFEKRFDNLKDLPNE